MSTARPQHWSPRTLAWIGPRRGALRGLADTLAFYDDSDDFLLAPGAYEHEAYVVHLAQRGVGGLDLVRLIRRRSAAVIVALGEAGGEAFVMALDSGADMVLGPDAPARHLAAALAAVHRRVAQAAPATSAWRLDEQRGVLQAPDGTDISLSGSDLTLVRCFADAEGGKVERGTLVEQLWGPDAGAMENALHATVYRLRKRIEQAGQALVPVHALAKVGYEFRAPLLKV